MHGCDLAFHESIILVQPLSIMANGTWSCDWLSDRILVQHRGGCDQYDRVVIGFQIVF